MSGKKALAKETFPSFSFSIDSQTDKTTACGKPEMRKGKVTFQRSPLGQWQSQFSV